MSGTPRTDTVLASYFNPGPSRLCDLARELERELNSANAAIRQQQLLEEENLRLKDRIKRLEEAGDALYENSDPTRWDSLQAANRKLDQQEEWRKAKEAKP